MDEKVDPERTVCVPLPDGQGGLPVGLQGGTIVLSE